MYFEIRLQSKKAKANQSYQHNATPSGGNQILKGMWNMIYEDVTPTTPTPIY